MLLIGATFGFNSGYAINPARDFGPRLFTSVAGWGSEVFRAGNAWRWVPIVAPLLGRNNRWVGARRIRSGSVSPTRRRERVETERFMSRVAFLGTGLLGSGMVEAMLRGGAQVTVWNRTLAKARALEAFGAQVEATPEDDRRRRGRSCSPGPS